MSGTLHKYLAFSRASFQEMLAYRLRYYTGIITYFLHVSVYFFIWKAVYVSGDEVIGGYRIGEMITYVAIGWVTRAFYFNNIDWDMAEDVIEGRIGVELTRPVDYQAIQYFMALGEALFRFILFAVPISLVVIPIYKVRMPASPVCAIAFTISILLSMAIFAGINFITGVAAVHLKNIIGVVRAKQMIIQILSGQIVPLAFFPAIAQKIMMVLPFAGIAHVPLHIYLGRYDGRQMAYGLLYQVLWAVALGYIGYIFWRDSARRLTIQGG